MCHFIFKCNIKMNYVEFCIHIFKRSVVGMKAWSSYPTLKCLMEMTMTK